MLKKQHFFHLFGIFFDFGVHLITHLIATPCSKKLEVFTKICEVWEGFWKWDDLGCSLGVRILEEILNFEWEICFYFITQIRTLYSDSTPAQSVHSAYNITLPITPLSSPAPRVDKNKYTTTTMSVLMKKLIKIIQISINP